MMILMKTTECNCGSKGCAVRSVRGLVPFCRMEAPKAAPDGLFSTYAQAVAASPEGKARHAGGGGLTGSPRKFKAL